jgi:hypothetical protein
MYLFGNCARRIPAPFGRREMRRFVVCCLFVAETAEIPREIGVEPLRDSASVPLAARLGLADNLKADRD